MAQYQITYYDDTTKLIEADRFSVDDNQVSFFKGRERIFYSTGIRSVALQSAISDSAELKMVRDAYLKHPAPE